MVVAYVHLFTLFMMVPIFNSMARIDPRLIEAAKDAGASRWAILREIVLPLCKSGIALGSIFVVTQVMGDFFVVKVMSGGQSASVVSALQNEIAALQYPPAAASAVILVIVVDADGRRHPPRRRRAQGTRELRTAVMQRTVSDSRPWTFYALTLSLRCSWRSCTAPMLVIYILSFQGPEGGLTFPMNGFSTRWFHELVENGRSGDIAGDIHALGATGRGRRRHHGRCLRRRRPWFPPPLLRAAAWSSTWRSPAW